MKEAAEISAKKIHMRSTKRPQGASRHHTRERCHVLSRICICTLHISWFHFLHNFYQ